MKKAFFIMILVFFSLSILQAETVLCCISDNRDADEVSKWKTSVMRAFEDGILSEFFDAGHIVTNSFLNECRSLSGEGVEENADIARIMGNRLGADSVVLFKLIFPESSPDNLLIPEAVEYAFYTNTGKVIASEAVKKLDIAAEMGEEELLDSFTAYAGSIASGMVARFQ